jgi:hypothetical protein
VLLALGIENDGNGIIRDRFRVANRGTSGDRSWEFAVVEPVEAQAREWDSIHAISVAVEVLVLHTGVVYESDGAAHLPRGRTAEGERIGMIESERNISRSG